MDAILDQKATYAIANLDDDRGDFPVCATCGETQYVEGTIERNGHIYIKFHCGQGGHNATERFVA